MYPRAPPSRVGLVVAVESMALTHPPAGLKANKQKPVVEVATGGRLLGRDVQEDGFERRAKAAEAKEEVQSQ